MYASQLPRHITPPYTQQAYYTEDVYASAPELYVPTSSDNSPDSIITVNQHLPTPSRIASTGSTRLTGPTLLPRIRCQDQSAENVPIQFSNGPFATHGQNLSNIHTSFSYQTRGHTTSPPPPTFENDPMSATSLPGSFYAATLSAGTEPPSHPFTSRYTPSPLHTNFTSPLTTNLDISQVHSRRSSLARAVSGPVQSIHHHARADSTSSIDESALIKSSYSTYRQVPQFCTAPTTNVSAPMPVTLSNLSTHPVSLAGPGPVQSLSVDHFDVFSPVSETSVSASYATPHESISTTTLGKYLTEPGPQPRLISRTLFDHQKHRDFGWWDVRNLIHWSDFNINTVLSFPEINRLLHVPIPGRQLPHPGSTCPDPENEYALRSTFAEYFGKRVNAALKQTQGAHHLVMYPHNSATTKPAPKPDFISCYENSHLKTHGGDQRGHVVGIIKGYEDFNSGMRNQITTEQVKYLRGLAQLQRIMREHRCRYGFIITEIELICVSAGAEDEEYLRAQQAGLAPQIDEGPRPIFGQLHVATPIPLSNNGLASAEGAPHLTVALALWYLHMLAKDDPLPGQASWKVDVGGAAAVSRHNHRPRDSWMPKKLILAESRQMKRLRGWIWPEEPLTRKEIPNAKRR